MKLASSPAQRRIANGGFREQHGTWPCAKYWAIVPIALLAGLFAAPALASDSISVSLSATVVPACRFLTAASPAGGLTVGNATLTYACSNGTAAAFTFAVPAATSVACASCSEIPPATGTVLVTSVGTGEGLGSGRDKTLTVQALPMHAPYDAVAPGPHSDTIIVTVSP